MSKFLKLVPFLMLLIMAHTSIKAQKNNSKDLSYKQKAIASIAAVTAKGDLLKLEKELNTGLDTGLTINQIKEVLVHLYAYAGFPRSIRGLQTFMRVLEHRREKGIVDEIGANVSLIKNDDSKYNRGKAILEKLTGNKEAATKTGYAAFAPEIEVFLKEHLFADIFERDVLTYQERELVTIAVLSSLGGLAPMLKSHLSISLNVGLTQKQLQQFVAVIKSTIGEKEAAATQLILNEVIQKK